MKTAEERAKEFVDKMPLVCAAFRNEIEKELVLFAKRQDKITRHAIAENLIMAHHDCETDTGDSAIRVDRAHNIAMNTQFV